ncbi:MAG: O-antigen ligase family protein [Candidatus Gracilibacteria bacterium]|nr:O-antigen ligase family protein [Candidatus Gracilibacteria bacterium]
MNKIFDRLTRAFLIVLPFNVIISVFFQFKLNLGIVSVYKEVFILALLGVLIYDKIKTRAKFVFDKLDYAVFLYVGYLILISAINLISIKAFIYGARYDFEFLLLFMIFKHGSYMLQEKLSYYIKIFLISGGSAILIGSAIRFAIGEIVLTHIGFSSTLSSWNSGQSVPIYHGIEGANIRRFQGIFDGPNQAAFFILTYIGLLFHYLKNRKEYYFYLFFGTFFLLGLIFLTYSRSSLLGVVIGVFFVCAVNLKTIFKKHKTLLVLFLVFMTLIGGIFYLKYSTNISNIILRSGSTKGHSERMIIGFNQFLNKPFGKGLASSGPAYRLSHDTKGTDEKNFIPESWYVQQLVEGGFIGFFFFMAILGLIFLRLYSVSIFFAGSFIAVLVMNSLLHTFEAVYISLIFFMFLGMFLNSGKFKNKRKQLGKLQ